MKKKILIIIGIIIISVIVFSFSKGLKPQQKYKTSPVSKNNIMETITASGTVNPVTSISVGTQVSGRITRIFADFNSPVKKGQLLAQIDTSLFAAQVEQGKANLYNAQSNLQRIQSITANDLKTYNRNKALYAKNFIAQSEVDLAEATYLADKAQINSAKAQIAQASAMLNTNLTNLQYTKIISPVDGIVITRNVDVGQTVAASFQTPTLFLVAQDLTKMQIDTNVAEADIGKVKVNQDVTYTLDGYSDMTFKGKVKQVRITPTTIQNVVTYDVVISVENKDMKLKPGMTANVSIITNNKENIKTVPNSALRFSPQLDEDLPRFKEQGVWVLDCQQTCEPKRISIKTGVTDGENTEVLSNEPKEGDNIIIGNISKNKAKKGNAPRMRMF